MVFRPIFASASALAAVTLVAGCVRTQEPEFAVTASVPPAAPGTLFRASNPTLADEEAHASCAGGYEKLGEQNYASETGTLQAWRIRCVPYSVFSPIPFL
jgi:hypothetical protein